jgi:AmmeMemoRadiSam system protein B
LKGVVAPHIDFERGGFCYAFAHREIWEKSTGHCFIIFGIAHTGMTHPFAITRKDFTTPLGKLETDRELVDTIQSCSYDSFHDEGVHRSEHLLSFNVFLRFYPSLPVKDCLILCGSFHENLQGASPMNLNPSASL